MNEKVSPGLGTGYGVKDYAERRYAVKEPPDLHRRNLNADVSDSGHAVNGMRDAEGGYDVDLGADSITFADADDCLVNEVGLLTLWRDGEMLAMFGPGKWVFVLDRKACFGLPPTQESMLSTKSPRAAEPQSREPESRLPLSDEYLAGGTV